MDNLAGPQLQNSRMARAEPQQSIGQGAPAAPNTAVAPQAGPPQGAAPAGPPAGGQIGASPEEPQGKTSFVDYAVQLLHGQGMAEQNVQQIQAGLEPAAEVIVQVGSRAYDDHMQRGIEPAIDEQLAVIEILADDVSEIGISQGVLSGEAGPENETQGKVQLMQVALDKWMKKYNIPEEALGEIAQNAQPDEIEAAKQMGAGLQQPAQQ